ncbi:MAG: hypothetical protein ACRDAX_08470 [Propionibacteriaceae bacterium]
MAGINMSSSYRVRKNPEFISPSPDDLAILPLESVEYLHNGDVVVCVAGNSGEEIIFIWNEYECTLVFKYNESNSMFHAKYNNVYRIMLEWVDGKILFTADYGDNLPDGDMLGGNLSIHIDDKIRIAN